MKHLKIAGLCLVSLLTMGMALAGNASAATLLWLLCLKTGTSGVAPTKYESNQCLKTNAALEGEWESAGLPTGGADTVRLLGFSLFLIDKGIGTTVYCSDGGKGVGVIESGKLITVTAEAAAPEKENCKVEGEFLTCKAGKLESIKGVNLPWTSENFETEGKFLANIIGKEGKKPGWAIKCGGATDECTESTEKPREGVELLSGVTGGILLVLSRFEARNKGNCSVGGNGNGEVKGLVAILLLGGNGLSLTTL